MKCADCQFWVGGADGSSEDEPFAVPGECHRKAPLPVLVPHDQIPFGQGYAYWPQTTDADFCGEFVAKIENGAEFV